MGNINARDPDYWNVPDDPGVRNTNWMSRLPKSKLLSDISIPGTHDSMARRGNLWVWCQSLSLDIQLEIGIRFFDIRCRHYKNGLPIHHSVFNQHCNFTDCIKTMVSFLQRNPSEALLVRVEQTVAHFCDGPYCTRSFCESVWAVLQLFPEDRFWFHQNIPTVGQAAGKIVILQDFELEMTLGIPYDHLKIEDDYKANAGDAKWKKVQANLESALAGSPSTMYLTYNSATGNPEGIEVPRQIARRMNPRLQSYVRPRRGRLGIIAIDYPGPKLVEDIINSNF